MTEYLLRKKAIDSDLAKLEKQYDAKIDEVFEKGHADGKLAILDMEIAQLKKYADELEAETQTKAGPARSSVRSQLTADLGRKIAEYLSGLHVTLVAENVASCAIAFQSCRPRLKTSAV